MSRWDNLKIDIHKKWRKWWFDVHSEDIAEYSWDYLFTGGKEIRPKLFCELYHYLSPDTLQNGELAFAIECIHISSIILDDTSWMDNSSERRGKQTLHVKFSPKIALLITNNVISIAIEIWKNNKPNHISDNIWQSFLISKLKKLTNGQSLDLDKKGNLIELASLKTGVLFELVTESVALCLELDTEFWRIWGNNLGILFQWMDDFLDREEDIIHSNRNAFNEAYDATLNNYSYLWNMIESGIGKQCFSKPFGIFIKHYFTNQINIKNSNHINNLTEKIIIPYPTNIIIPEIIDYNFEGKHIPAIFTGKNIIKQLFKVSDKLFIIPSIQNNLWHINENEWEHLSEIKDLFTCIENDK